ESPIRYPGEHHRDGRRRNGSRAGRVPRYGQIHPWAGLDARSIAWGRRRHHDAGHLGPRLRRPSRGRALLGRRTRDNRSLNQHRSLLRRRNPHLKPALHGRGPTIAVMSTPTDIVRRLVDALAALDVAGLAALISDDVKVHEPESLPYAGTYEGRQGFLGVLL